MVPDEILSPEQINFAIGWFEGVETSSRIPGQLPGSLSTRVTKSTAQAFSVLPELAWSISRCTPEGNRA